MLGMLYLSNLVMSRPHVSDVRATSALGWLTGVAPGHGICA